MLPSKKLLSAPIVSLKEGQQIGFVRNIVINPQTKSVAALVVDPKRFFREQRIIPFNRVVSIGENAITVSTESQAEKAASLPDILQLIKEKTVLIGTKVMTANGKNLGVIEEFYIHETDGKIASIIISSGKLTGLFNGKAKLDAADIVTIGSDVLVAAQDADDRLEVYNKGFNETFKNFVLATSSKAAQGGQKINNYWRNRKNNELEKSQEPPIPDEEQFASSSAVISEVPETEKPEISENLEETEPLSSKQENNKSV